MISETAPAKLNLALHVRSRRVDGYHELETLFAFVRDGDRLTVERADTWSLRITGPFAHGLSAGVDNLVLRAAAAFVARFGGTMKFAVTLAKRLPVASGIGGGSADAAAMLRALARFDDVMLDDPALFSIAAELGADVPACLAGVTAIGGGRGERLQPVAGLPQTPVLLVNPGVTVSTPAVFARWDGVDRGALPDGDAQQIAMEGRNDLQAPALTLAPIIADVLALLEPDATLARMSGSGATCFALYDDIAARDTAATRIATARPGWWTSATTLA